MLTCVIIAANLYIGDALRIFPTQGNYYFLKQQHSIVVYTETKRISSIKKAAAGRAAVEPLLSGDCMAWEATRCVYSTVYYTTLYCTILYYTILYYTILYYTILYCTILYYTILYYAILYYTILYYTLLYYTILYYTLLCYTLTHSTLTFYTTVPYILQRTLPQLPLL